MPSLKSKQTIVNILAMAFKLEFYDIQFLSPNKEAWSFARI